MCRTLYVIMSFTTRVTRGQSTLPRHVHSWIALANYSMKRRQNLISIKRLVISVGYFNNYFRKIQTL